LVKGVYMRKKNILICKAVKYHSLCDEDAFFEWIKKIPSIVRYDGALDELYLYMKGKNISNRDLRELIALFYRYKVEMSQLQIFMNKRNQKWFHDGKIKGYWHARVFGKKVK